MNTILETILTNKKIEVAAIKNNMTLAKKCSKAYEGKFKNALSTGAQGRIIAEIKRRSPSKGILADIPDAAQLAKQYIQGGAAAISVLTDQKFFSGTLQDLYAVSQIALPTACAVLRKDFIIDTLQLSESVDHGADAVLLIAAVLKNQLPLFIETAYQIGLDALVEVHTEAECAYAIESGAQIIGINHRNLDSFHMEPDRAVSLLKNIPAHIIKVAESGIHTETRAAELCLAGFDAVLIGEALVTAKHPELFIHQVKTLCAAK